MGVKHARGFPVEVSGALGAEDCVQVLLGVEGQALQRAECRHVTKCKVHVAKWLAIRWPTGLLPETVGG
eukprot:2914015-Prymnesium_polylepis.1